jgi:hypothetical protein
MSAPVAFQWRSCPSVKRWRRHLLDIVGCSAEEVNNKLDLLFQFCAGQGVSPDRIIEDCRHAPNALGHRASYLRRLRGTPADLVLHSFLIHNGINTFGELLCMPLGHRG